LDSKNDGGPKPIRVGLLIDTPVGQTVIDEVIVPTFQLVLDEFTRDGQITRPVEFVVRTVRGLPNGSFLDVRDAFHELVAERCLIIFGPMITENGTPLMPYVEKLGEVPLVAMAGTERMLGEWIFALNNGSMADETLVIASIAALDGRREIAITMDEAPSGGGVTHVKSMIGQEYLQFARAAVRDVGLHVVAELPMPLDKERRKAALARLAKLQPDAILHLGLGQGLLGMNEALEEIGWAPPRYTQTSFEAAANNEEIRRKLAGWIGLDQYDERNTTGQAFLDRFEARFGRRPEYYMSVYMYDMARVILRALSNAQPLTGLGVKEALERIKMMPAACGAPGTRIKFGRFMRQGWVGSEYLVARRILPDGSRSVMYGTIEGLVTQS
jgi:ABC-type branched-subunit amino acid transport system substrate-binding protein